MLVLGDLDELIEKLGFVPFDNSAVIGKGAYPKAHFLGLPAFREQIGIGLYQSQNSGR